MAIILAMLGVASCEDTKIINRDFQVSTEAEDATTLLNKAINIKLVVSNFDKNNKEEIQTFFKISKGQGFFTIAEKQVKAGGNVVLDFRKESVFTFTYTPTQDGKNTIIVESVSKLISRSDTLTIDVRNPEMSISFVNVPENLPVNTNAEFYINVSKNDDEDLRVSADIKEDAGEITIFGNGKEGKENITLKLGINKVSFRSNRSGINEITFKFSGKYGYPREEKISINITSPAWMIKTPKRKDSFPAYQGIETEFNIELTELDNNGPVNEYSAMYRFLKGGGELKVNEVLVSTARPFLLRKGNNVSKVKASGTGETEIEFVVTDKFNRQVKDTAIFKGQQAIFPIEFSVTPASQKVPQGEPAKIRVSIHEKDYIDVFTLEYKLLTGAGEFSGKDTETLSEGEHNFHFIPRRYTNTFLLTVRDKNGQKQEKAITVMGDKNPITAKANISSIESRIGVPNTFDISVHEANYNKKIFLNFDVGDNQQGTIKVGNKTLQPKVQTEIALGTTQLSYIPQKMGRYDLNINLSDERGQKSSIVIPVIVKAIVTLIAEQGGIVSGEGSYDQEGIPVTVTATPDKGYEFDGWYENGKKVSSTQTYTFPIRSDRNLVAKFKLIKLTIKVTGTKGGSVHGGGIHDIGSTVSIAATPDEYHLFDGWYVNGEKVSSGNPYSFVATQNLNIEGRFKARGCIFVEVYSETATEASSHFPQGGFTSKFYYKISFYEYPDKKTPISTKVPLDLILDETLDCWDYPPAQNGSPGEITKKLKSSIKIPANTESFTFNHGTLNYQTNKYKIGAYQVPMAITRVSLKLNLESNVGTMKIMKSVKSESKFRLNECSLFNDPGYSLDPDYYGEYNKSNPHNLYE